MFGAGNVRVELTVGDQPDRRRAQRRAGRAGRRGRGAHGRDAATCTTPRRGTPGWPRRWRRSGRAAAWPRWTAGWPRRAAATCGPATRRPRRLSRYPGVVERTLELAAACAFDFRVIAPRLPDFPVPGGGTEASYLREPGAGRRPWAATARRHAERVDGAYAQIAHELDVIERARLPRLLPDRAQHRRVLRGRADPVPGPGLGGELGRLLRARDHQRGPGPARAAVRAVPVLGPGRAARHRPGHRAPAPGGGHPVRLPDLRPGTGGAGGQRDLLPAADGAAGRGPGAGLLAGAAERVVPAGRSARLRPGPAGPAGRGRPRAGARAGQARCSGCRGTWASTRAAW